MSLPKVLAISGSVRKESSNWKILEQLKLLYAKELDIELYDELAQLPHFDPNIPVEETPEIVKRLYHKIAASYGIIICTPEYVFSPPAILKNALEWTVAETVFSYKPAVLIVASSAGQKTFEAMDLILKTLLQEEIPAEQKVLINGVRARLDANGQIADLHILEQVKTVISAFKARLNS